MIKKIKHGNNKESPDFGNQGIPIQEFPKLFHISGDLFI